MIMKAIWNGVVLADSDQTIVVEGNHYFPPDSLHKEFFQDSSHHTECSWKGTCSYYHLSVNGQANQNAAWYYPEPKPAAGSIKGYVAFWKGVQVVA
jgi:uncharacterized protein (DUF427 family)